MRFVFYFAFFFSFLFLILFLLFPLSLFFLLRDSVSRISLCGLKVKLFSYEHSYLYLFLDNSSSSA